MTLYILDDDKIELAAWHRTAQSFDNLRVELFDNSAVFKSYIFKQAPDVCIIDYVMPLQPGTEVCRWVKEINPKIQVYMCSGLDSEEYVLLAESMGAKFISKSKPFKERLEVVINGC